MFETQIIMPGSQNTVKNICIKLWADNFNDTPGYINYYFNNRWHKSITFLSDSASMLHLNPYQININGKEITLYYIVGVCTSKEYRKRGYMDTLLKKSLDFMYNNKFPFTYLMPASEKIYKPYGFTGIYPVSTCDINITDIRGKSSGSTDIIYNKLDTRQKEALCSYTENKLSGNFSCYVVHNSGYFEELNKEMAACSGNIVTFWEKDSLQCLGYIVYMCEDFPEIAESVFEEKIQTDILYYFYNKNYYNIKLYETYFWNIPGCSLPKNYLMARIINLKTFIMGLYCVKRQELWICIEDKYISGNNGKWHIIIDKESSLCQQCSGQESNKWEVCTIEEFGSRYLPYYRYYLNEFV